MKHEKFTLLQAFQRVKRDKGKTPLYCEGDSVKREKRANKDHLFKDILGNKSGQK